VDKKSDDGEKAVRLCNYVDVYKNEKVTMDLDFMEATATDIQIDRFGLHVGDVVITKDSETPDDIGVPALIAETAPDLVCGYHLTILRPNEMEVAGGYLFYAVSSRLSAYQFYLASNGVTRFGLTYQGTKNLRIAIPSVREQQQITAFLDWKTGQIDLLIAKKSELIEKLKEKRIAVITQAVTKGIDPDAPLCDSGMAWLGEVPKRWEVKRLRFLLCERFANGLFKKAEFWGDGNRIVNVTNLYVHNDVVDETQLERLECDEAERQTYSATHGDFFVVRSSLKLEGIGKSAVLLNPSEETVFECHTVRGRPSLDEVHPRFLNLFLNSTYARQYFMTRANVVTMATIDQERIKSLVVALPPYDEQQRIAEYLDHQVSRIDSMVAAAEMAVEKLTEYRSALITAAVTGKIDAHTIVISTSG
jgi:type I restriction enzyme S subunit